LAHWAHAVAAVALLATVGLPFKMEEPPRGVSLERPCSCTMVVVVRVDVVPLRHAASAQIRGSLRNKA
jgi:hypothetical protein